MIEDAAAGSEARRAAGPAFTISAVGVVLVALGMRQAVAGIQPVGRHERLAEFARGGWGRVARSQGRGQSE